VTLNRQVVIVTSGDGAGQRPILARVVVAGDIRAALTELDRLFPVAGGHWAAAGRLQAHVVMGGAALGTDSTRGNA
jgi:hypothetical protein